ncbi:hypothetical protein ACQR06_26045 [Bradyrhizobium sp. HKCCYLRH1065]|uniref:hypothetical protein n=1 Tax=Bradyrhizobium sp. HKCCYLRH1065 TaxID=3420753 RepID=UPI003EB8FC5B
MDDSRDRLFDPKKPDRLLQIDRAASREAADMAGFDAQRNASAGRRFHPTFECVCILKPKWRVRRKRKCRRLRGSIIVRQPAKQDILFVAVEIEFGGNRAIRIAPIKQLRPYVMAQHRRERPN